VVNEGPWELFPPILAFGTQEPDVEPQRVFMETCTTKLDAESGRVYEQSGGRLTETPTAPTGLTAPTPMDGE